jgi:membrane associated rhomboid family serine protease
MLDDRSYMREPGYKSAWSVTTILIIANIAIYVVQELLSTYVNGAARFFANYLALSPRGISSGLIYQLLTFQFLHAGPLHVLGNCLGLYCFGRSMEDYFGARKFVTFYLMGGAIGGLAQVILGFLFSPFNGPVFGASAGVFAIIAAFATRNPDHPITLLVFFVLPVTFKAKVLLWLSVGLAVFGILIPTSNVAHAAHLGGIIFGVLFLKWHQGDISLPNFRVHSKKTRERVIMPLYSKSKPSSKPQEFIKDEVDPILDKISAHGIHSLTDRERQVLDAARKKMGR